MLDIVALKDFSFLYINFLLISWIGFLVISIVFCVICFRKPVIREKLNNQYKKLSFDSKLIFFTIGLTFFMWSLQFGSELYSNYLVGIQATTNGETVKNVAVWEVWVSSLLHALKSFGADDNFLSSTNGFKELILAVCSKNKLSGTTSSVFATIYSLFASTISLIAPLTSATIIFEVLTNIFPQLKLWRWRKFCKKEVYFFSELNERSFTLAKSINKTDSENSVIIFANVNKSKGAFIEFYCKEVKRFGAICLSDNITHIKKQCKGNKKLFLINDDEIENLQILTELADEFDKNSKNSTEIYLFCQDYAYIDIEKQFRAKFNEKCAPVVIPVRHYRNLITNMLETTPLYEPIVHKQKEDRILNVTILGIGDIGTEMFLNTYWIGQMLDCKLRINVVSKEPEGTFENKLDYINPEILKTTKKNEEILRIYRDKDAFSEPYCEYNYFSCDVKSTEFSELLKNVTGIADTHYFLVSLGTDEENLSVANMLKTEIGRLHISDKTKSKQVEKTIINYVVYNSSLNKTLGDGNLICSYSADEPDIYMQAVGGIENIYSAKNIFMGNYISSAEAADESYDKKRGEIIRKNAYEKRLKSEYEYWSNLALRLHFKYKVFSATPFKQSLFNKEKDYDIKADEYKKLVRSCKNENELKIQHNLQWLEHRRWNAFLRTMGYRQTNDYEQYVQLTESHKQIEMKLHPCLVECDKKGEYIELNESGEISKTLIKKVDGKVVFKKIINGDGAEIVALVTEKEHVWVSKGLVNNDGEPVEKFNIVTGKGESVSVLNADYFDLLDQLTIDLAMLSTDSKVSIYDFKMYDYPNSDYLSEV